jgi:hypothetical protein
MASTPAVVLPKTSATVAPSAPARWRLETQMGLLSASATTTRTHANYANVLPEVQCVHPFENALTLSSVEEWKRRVRKDSSSIFGEYIPSTRENASAKTTTNFFSLVLKDNKKKKAKNYIKKEEEEVIIHTNWKEKKEDCIYKRNLSRLLLLLPLMMIIYLLFQPYSVTHW